jgi:cbb3-type cytochrome oxidase subunit 1
MGAFDAFFRKMNSFDTATTPAKQGKATLRLPVILFLSSAVFWLVVGSFLGCLAAWKLVVPSWRPHMGNQPPLKTLWHTAGRLRLGSASVFGCLRASAERRLALKGS